MSDSKPECCLPGGQGADPQVVSARPGNSRLHEPGGYREVLGVAMPLVASTASVTVMLFVDRMFLSWHGQASVAASVPGGATFWMIICLFLGIAEYVTTIVAQHFGAGDLRACMRAAWQGVIFSVMAVPLMLIGIPVGCAILSWGGHDPEVLRLEKEYFTLLMLGGVTVPLNAALSSFFSGRGETSAVMWGNFLGSLARIGADYVLIFGKLGFPEMGIRGAGIATIIAGFVPTLYWGYLLRSPEIKRVFGTWKELRWDGRLFGMLMRYGIPSGVHFFLEVGSFTVFVLLVGRLGEQDLALTNIVFSVELLSFLPMIGMSIAAATLVGRHIGEARPDLSEKSAYSAFRLTFVYCAMMSLLFVLIPGVFLELFRTGSDATGNDPAMMRRGASLLRLVALYSLFDCAYVVFAGALRGAGDTRFVMWAQIVLGWFLFVPPVYVAVEKLHAGLYGAWCCLLGYAIALGLVYWLRFRSGVWKTIKMLARP
ncbi:MAG: MATE family efflux transporter [Thermodesulfobacteriota bacterium]